MTKYLITPSLLSSYAYYIQDEWKSPAESRADFLRTLSREKFAPNEAMKKGNALEDSISGKAKGIPAPEGHPIYEIGKIVSGGLWQQSVKKEIKVGNQEFLLYGRTDVIKRDTVYDIKFTSNYELGKFLDSSQHLIYLYCSDLPNFSYLISDGKDWWREDYVNDGNVENRIKSMISDFMGYLENDKEAKEMFLTKWESKNNNNAQ
ncbi:MAG: hypothetical protein WCJ58_00880 [bacterium]